MEGIFKDNQYPFGGLFPVNIPAVLSGVGKKLRDRMYRTVKPESYSREQLENFIIGKSREAYRDPNSEALLGKYTGQDSIIADYTQAPDGLPIGRVLTQAEIDSLGANNNTLAKYAVNDIIVPSKSKQGAFEFAHPNQSGNAPHLPYNYNDVPSSRWTHSKQLGSYEQSKEKEGDRYSITYKDVWDINPFRGKSSSDDPTWQSFIKAGKDVGLDKMGDIVPFGKPFEIHGRQYYDSKGRPVKSKSEGGFLYQPKDAWDSLSMAGKSEMIKVAVKNGITDLKTIREKYNEFAEGGDKETPRPVTTEGAGYIPPVVSGPNAAQAGTLKDIAYRIMSQSSAENRGLGHIAKGVLESIAGQPYDQMYTGSFSGGNDDMEPDTTRDLNHLIVYGNTKGQYQPKELRGFDYSNYLQKNYGVNTMPTYEGRIVMANKVNIPTEYSPLVEWLSDRPKYGYYVDPDKDADVIQDWDNLPFLTVDDTASYRRSFRRDKSGKPELANQDLIDYGGKDYGRKYGTLAGLQGAVLNRVINSPVILDQGLPVNFTNNPEDFEQGEGWYNTLKSIVDINHILQDNGNGNYSYPLVLPDINVFGRKRAEGGKIHIKPENRGKFTALKERTGHSATWFKEHGTPAQKKMATFALNVRKWKHGLGGNLFSGEKDHSQQMQLGPRYWADQTIYHDWQNSTIDGGTLPEVIVSPTNDASWLFSDGRFKHNSRKPLADKYTRKVVSNYLSKFDNESAEDYNARISRLADVLDIRGVQFKKNDVKSGKLKGRAHYIDESATAYIDNIGDIFAEVAHPWQYAKGNNNIEEEVGTGKYDSDSDPRGGTRYAYPDTAEGETHSFFEPALTEWIETGKISKSSPILNNELSKQKIKPKDRMEVADSASSWNRQAIERRLLANPNQLPLYKRIQYGLFDYPLLDKKKALGGNLFDGTTEGSQQMQIGLKVTNGWKPYTLGDILANAARIEQQKQAMEDRFNNNLVLSNDATSIANGRPQNRHLERGAVEGAKAHRAWEEEHPIATAWGNVLGAVPLAVASYPFVTGAVVPSVTALGDAAAATTAGKALTSALSPVMTAATTSWYGTPAWEWANTGLNAIFSAHGLNTAMEEKGVSPTTALELAPMLTLGKPIKTAADNIERRGIEVAMRSGAGADGLRNSIDGFSTLRKTAEGRERLKRIGNYILTGDRKGIDGTYNSLSVMKDSNTPGAVRVYRGSEVSDTYDASKKDLIDAFLYGETIDPSFGLTKIAQGENFGVHAPYIAENYAYKASKIPVYEVNTPFAIPEAEVTPSGKWVGRDAGTFTSKEGSATNVAGHLKQTGMTAEGMEVEQGQDIWKFLAKDYWKKWLENGKKRGPLEKVLLKAGLHEVNRLGTPVITRTKWAPDYQTYDGWNKPSVFSDITSDFTLGSSLKSSEMDRLFKVVGKKSFALDDFKLPTISVDFADLDYFTK